MTEKRYSHDAIVIIDHLKEDLIYINGKDELLELAEYVDKLQEENATLKEELNKIKSLLLKKVKELNDDYNKSAKAGMPTGGIIGELDSFEEICEIMEWTE